jgi:hypothetical protein
MSLHLIKKNICFFSAIIFLICIPARAKAAEPQAAVTLLSTTYLPEIIGDFDHFAVDLKRNHLFVSAEVHHSIEMFDLKTGATSPSRHRRRRPQPGSTVSSHLGHARAVHPVLCSSCLRIQIMLTVAQPRIPMTACRLGPW